jgi:aspartyl-tRNA(Asn)/glutamyl-tRNA(Gln) amidotransferase subunit B
MNVAGIDIVRFGEHVTPERLCELILCTRGVINIATAKSVLEEMFKTGRSAADIIEERGLSQITDSGEIGAEIISVIESNAQAVADYRAGKIQSLKFLVGQVMKATGGRANPQVVTELLRRRLEEE